MTSGAMIIDYECSVAHEVMMTDNAKYREFMQLKTRKHFVIAVVVVYTLQEILVDYFSFHSRYLKYRIAEVATMR